MPASFAVKFGFASEGNAGATRPMPLQGIKKMDVQRAFVDKQRLLIFDGKAFGRCYF